MPGFASSTQEEKGRQPSSRAQQCASTERSARKKCCKAAGMEAEKSRFLILQYCSAAQWAMDDSYGSSDRGAQTSAAGV